MMRSTLTSSSGYGYQCPPLVLGAMGGALIPSLLLAFVALQGTDFGQPMLNLNYNYFRFGGSIQDIIWESRPLPLPTTTPDAANCTPSLPPALPDAYSEFYKSSLPVCGREGQNVVLSRADGINSQDLLPIRPWSLHPLTYPSDPSLPFCTTPLSLLQSLSLGTRLPLPPVPQTNSTDGSDETYVPTRFVPFGCNFRWYTAVEACAIMGRYSSLMIAGDSLSRHTTQALVMALTGDGVYGGIARMTKNPELYINCLCDGQFSEHSLCRSHGESMYTMPSPHAYGICPNLDSEFEFRYADKNPDFGHFCSSDPRPRFVLLQGGAHQQSKADHTIKYIVDPAMESLNRTLSECEHEFEVKVVWTGLNSQAPLLDERYPQQSDAKAVEFNEVVGRVVREKYGLESLDFVNMTRKAEVSDGYHYLTEVNLIKAMYLFNLLDLWSELSGR